MNFTAPQLHLQLVAADFPRGVANLPQVASADGDLLALAGFAVAGQRLLSGQLWSRLAGPPSSGLRAEG